MRGAAAVLLTALLTLPGAAGTAGERAFRKCYSCHSVDPAETGLPGPNLHGIVGRAAATSPGYDEYSDALKLAGGRGLFWDEAALDRFLADPRSFLPGTSMAFVGIKDPAERQALITFLREEAGAP